MAFVSDVGSVSATASASQQGFAPDNHSQLSNAPNAAGGQTLDAAAVAVSGGASSNGHAHLQYDISPATNTISVVSAASDGSGLVTSEPAPGASSADGGGVTTFTVKFNVTQPTLCVISGNAHVTHAGGAQPDATASFGVCFTNCNGLAEIGHADNANPTDVVAYSQVLLPLASGSYAISISTSAAGSATSVGNGTNSTASLDYTLTLSPPPVGSCCLSDQCLTTYAAACASIGGAYQGDGAVCEATCLGACCFQQGADGCYVTTSSACASKGGTFQGAGSTCGASCKLGDIDGDSVVDINDLFDVINAWGPCPPPCPPCNADLNGDCTIDIDDLFIVINNWS